MKHLGQIKKHVHLLILISLFAIIITTQFPHVAHAVSINKQFVPVQFAAEPPPATCVETDNTSANCKAKVDCADVASLTPANCGIVKWLLIFINALAALVGIVVIGMIIIGGIQYSSAGDDPNKVQEAKKKITNALLALLTFIFMYAFLQWVVPGGVF